jgi:hypothetical protein
MISKRRESPVTLIGGAKYTAELDAMRATDEGVRLGASL